MKRTCFLLLFVTTGFSYGFEPPTCLMSSGEMSQGNLTSFFLLNEPGADSVLVAQMALAYIEECRIEGVNSDIAFIQMCLETGFLRFQGLVSPYQNNFCGLGATGPGHPGECFSTIGTGIRAHVQHLKAYGSEEPLVLEQVDPRFHYVNPRGRAPDVFSLAGTWAADREYGNKLYDLLVRLYDSAVVREPLQASP